MNFSDLLKSIEIREYTAIEFFGFPASGKTTLAKKIKQSHPGEILWKEDFSIFSKYLFFNNFFFLFKKTLVLAQVSLKSKHLLPARELVTILSFLNRSEFSRKSNKILILDHGIIQEFIKLYKNAKTKKIFLKLIKMGFFTNHVNHLFVYIPAEKDKCIEREKRRKSLFWDNINELNQIYDEYEIALSYTLKARLIRYKVFKGPYEKLV